MPFIRIWIHLIWSTKNRLKIIRMELRPILIDHIFQNGGEKGIYIDAMNCVSDHCHALISLGSTQDISKVASMIKGESSYWVNKNNLVQGKFEWQDEYLAISVSESQVSRVREYIRNQIEHHKQRTYSEEYQLFLQKNGFKELG